MTRYAIYFLPNPATGLWTFGCSVLGYDAVTQHCVPFPDHPIFREEGALEISSEPRRYGFHATLKAPFALSYGQTEEDLATALSRFASSRPRFTLPKLHIDRLGSFLALVPARPIADLDDLASACVMAFEPFRAPVSDDDRSRRLKSPLTPRQIELLDRWGYPYVLDEFRFHMTLTGTLDKPRAEVTAAVLREIYAEIDEPVDVDAITLLRQSGRSEPFVVVQRYPLAA